MARIRLSQLLEFRHYDEFLTHELENVYDFLEKGSTGTWARWRTARAAAKLHTVLLDVNELTEQLEALDEPPLRV